MKGFIKKTLAVFSLVGGLAAFAGCQTSWQEKYYRYVDPCWPERYSAMSAKSVNTAFAGQVNNGHILDQTLYHGDVFEPGTANLLPSGMYKLDIIAKRRPAPDTKVYLQTAQDVAYDEANPNDFIQKRVELDNARRGAILAYLNATTAGRGLIFDVAIHNPPEVGMPAILPVTGYNSFMAKSISERGANVGGILSTQGGGGGASGAGGGGR